MFISEKDYQIALNRLKAEQEIAKIVANQKLTEADKGIAIERERQIETAANGIAVLEERLEHLRAVNQTVFKSMENAIESFVKTGKFSFKDFAGSVIKDILAIYMKAQLLQMLGGAGNTIGSLIKGGMTAYSLGTNFGSQQTTMLTAQTSGFFAGGGTPPVGIPAVVGENGPELFIPKTSGTIIPNQQMSNYMGGQPQIVYNGPYIANMQAIDTQSATQFLARNKSAVWAANQSASRSLPQSR